MRRLLPILGLLFAFSAPLQANETLERGVAATYKIFNTKSTATGFFIEDPKATKESPTVLLVTAKHVLDATSGDTVLIVLREPLPDKEGMFKRRDWPLNVRKDGKTLWTPHPEQDIAVMRIQLPEDSNVTPLPYTSIATEKTLRDTRFTVGTELIGIGYPVRTEANDSGFPIARAGMVSGYPIHPIQERPIFLFDGQSFPGCSGGPLIGKTSKGAPILYGLTVGQIRADDKITTLFEERTVHFPLGVSTIVHAQYIRDTIDLLDQPAPSATTQPANSPTPEESPAKEQKD
jgi:S1-C subfamily serine protease